MLEKIDRLQSEETLINWLHERITSLRGTCFLIYLVDMSRLLCSVRLVLHLVRRINQRFPKEALKNYCARSCCVDIRLKMLIYIL